MNGSGQLSMDAQVEDDLEDEGYIAPDSSFDRRIEGEWQDDNGEESLDTSPVIPADDEFEGQWVDEGSQGPNSLLIREVEDDWQAENSEESVERTSVIYSLRDEPNVVDETDGGWQQELRGELQDERSLVPGSLLDGEIEGELQGQNSEEFSGEVAVDLSSLDEKSMNNEAECQVQDYQWQEPESLSNEEIGGESQDENCQAPASLMKEETVNQWQGEDYQEPALFPSEEVKSEWQNENYQEPQSLANQERMDVWQDENCEKPASPTYQEIEGEWQEESRQELLETVPAAPFPIDESLITNEEAENRWQRDSGHQPTETAPGASPALDESITGKDTEGEWQDEICQGPIDHQNGTSLLCNACRNVFCGYHVYGDLPPDTIEGPKTTVWRRHLKYLEVLESSALRGCAFCNLILARLRRQRLIRQHEPAEVAGICYCVRLYEGDGSPYLEITYNINDIQSRSIRQVEPIEFGCTLKTGQDSYADWEQEASRMKDVYRNALLTIAATGATGSSVGCFFERDLDLVRTVAVSISWLGVPEGTYDIWDSLIWQENIVNAPLNQRAWVVQERLLPPRILHFGRDQMAWECQEMEACETFPDELPALMDAFGGIYSKALLEERGEDLVALHWEEIAETYSRGCLTKEDDKCIALAGIVGAIKGRLADTYHAGLWGSHLVQHLCWTTNAFENQERQVAARRPLNYRAPSWSWLSVDSSIQFYYPTTSSHDDDETMIEILDIEIHNTTQNHLSSIESGHILARGFLKSAKWAYVGEEPTKFLILDGHLIDHGQFWNFMHSQIIMDIGVSEETYDDIVCLPLLSHETPNHRFKDGDYIGLIMVATGEREDEYRRIGCFQMGWGYGEYLLKEDQGDESGTRTSLVRSTFLIV
ncbi:MAG: hypothetical protein Q9164_002554 [Protoblastenia rupestris]